MFLVQCCLLIFSTPQEKCALIYHCNLIYKSLEMFAGNANFCCQHSLSYVYTEGGRINSFSTCAKCAFSYPASLLFSFSAADSFLLDVICSLLLPLNTFSSTLPLLTLREALGTNPSLYGSTGSDPVSFAPPGWSMNSLFCMLGSILFLLDLRVGRMTPETSGMHSCHTLRYLDELGTLWKKGALACTSQVCCFAQRSLIWSVTWLGSGVFVFSGKEGESAGAELAQVTELPSPHRACVTFTRLPGLHCSNPRSPTHTTVTFCWNEVNKIVILTFLCSGNSNLNLNSKTLKKHESIYVVLSVSVRFPKFSNS